MADTKLSELPVKSTTVDLTADIFAVVSGGVTEQVPANLIPFTKILTANTSIYIATTGNDSTGDGSVGLPYLTPHKAYEHLQDYFLGAGVIATIQCAAGTYTIASTIIPYHPQGSQVLLKGATMLGTVVDGDFVASAATTTTNLETRYATIFRGNFAGAMTYSGDFGTEMLFRCEDILFDGNAVSTYGLFMTNGANLRCVGISCISMVVRGIHVEGGGLGDINGDSSFSHNAIGVWEDSNSTILMIDCFTPYNTDTGIFCTGRSQLTVFNTVSRANTNDDYVSDAVSYMRIASGLATGQFVRCANRSSINAASVVGVTYSPAHAVNGNNDSIIYA